MSTLYLRVTMPDGSRWDVPALVVAESRASACVWDGPAPPRPSTAAEEKEFAEEVAFGLACTEELVDWAQNNMNWSDVADVAVRVALPLETDLQEGWINGPKTFVRRPREQEQPT